MFLAGAWHTLELPAPAAGTSRADGLDVEMLQREVLGPLLKIGDVRTDKRIDFVGGIRGTAELERLVTSGQAAVAFAMHPVGLDDLMAIADAGGIMPPKSTWFEPKLRDGLLVHRSEVREGREYRASAETGEALEVGVKRLRSGAEAALEGTHR